MSTTRHTTDDRPRWTSLLVMKGPILQALVPVKQPTSNEAKVRAVFVLPWSLEAPGGVNEVVKCLIRHGGGASRATLMEVGYFGGPIKMIRQGTYDVMLACMPSPLDRKHLVRGLLSFSRRLPAALVRLALKFREIRPTAVNVHFPGLWALSLLLAVRLAAPGCRFVLSFHGADIDHIERAPDAERRLWSLLVRSADSVTCCSSFLLRRLEAAVGMKIAGLVAYNGIDAESIEAEVAMGDATSPLDERGAYIVNVGTFEEKKGQDVLLRAFAKLKPDFPELRLMLVGRDGPHLSVTRSLAHELGIQDSVDEYVDVPHEMALRLIRGATVFALSSRREPFGIVLLEAAHFSVPIVASRVGGVPEILEHDASALLVRPDDPDELTLQLRRLLEDGPLRRRLAAYAKQNVASRFTGDAAYEAYRVAMSGSRMPSVAGRTT